MGTVPTLGRVVHYRLVDRWILAIVLDDVGATVDLATELELHPGSKGYGPVHAVNVPGARYLHRCTQFPDDFNIGLSGDPREGIGRTVLNVKRGEQPGQWRWPPMRVP